LTKEVGLGPVFSKLSTFYLKGGQAMAQKILIAMDESDNALRAVEFVAKSFSTANSVTLFSVLIDSASLCKMDSPELIPLFKSQQSSFCLLESKKRELVTQAMQKGKDVLMEAGFPAENIQVKTECKKSGVARDILSEAGNGYDVVVMGRRGISGIREFFLGSTSQKVFSGAKEISVLIVN
jgi:nucleotide-binding universal stress UspA family protein